MTAPRPASLVKEQLTDLSKVRESMERHGIADFASQMAMQAVQNESARLLDELRAAELLESGHDVQLEFAGDPVVAHSIGGRFFGLVLFELQETLNAVAQVRSHSPTSRGVLPGGIVAENRLLLAQTFASSFGV